MLYMELENLCGQGGKRKNTQGGGSNGRKPARPSHLLAGVAGSIPGKPHLSLGVGSTCQRTVGEGNRDSRAVVDWVVWGLLHGYTDPPANGPQFPKAWADDTHQEVHFLFNKKTN